MVLTPFSSKPQPMRTPCKTPAILSPWLAAFIVTYWLCIAAVCGNGIINHPVSLAFASKFNSLCRMTTERELAALGAIDQIEKGESIEYEVIPL